MTFQNMKEKFIISNTLTNCLLPYAFFCHFTSMLNHIYHILTNFLTSYFITSVPWQNLYFLIIKQHYFIISCSTVRTQLVVHNSLFTTCHTQLVVHNFSLTTVSTQLSMSYILSANNFILLHFNYSSLWQNDTTDQIFIADCVTTGYSFKNFPILNDKCLTRFPFYNIFSQKFNGVITIYQSNVNLPEIKQSKLNKVYTKNSHYGVTQGSVPSLWNVQSMKFLF